MPRTEGRRGPRDTARMTCASCRTRKIRCDGHQPSCRVCLAYERVCHYDKPPSLAQAVAMAKRIEQLEQQSAPTSDSTTGAPDSALDETQTTTSTTTRSDGRTEVPMSPLHSSTASFHNVRTTTINVVAEDGASQSQDEPRMQPLNKDQVGFWSSAAIEAAATYFSIARQQVSQLLEIHWTWVHPVFLFVPKTLFLREFAVGGPLASKLLLCTICLHSTRFAADNGLRVDLEAKVKLLLGQALFVKPSLPTVQALLQLSAWEMGRGETSLAWSFSGMAFRMAIDLGIFTSRLKPDERISAYDRSAGQLAWSCYTWDTAISLYLGRAPFLHTPPSFDPLVVDEEAEHAAWSPALAMNRFDSRPAHIQSCFVNFCKLHVVIKEVLVEVYGRKSPACTQIAVDLANKLRSWRNDSPEHLRIDQECQQCPPAHIVIQNLLYHSTAILLHRPFVQVQACREICRDAVREIVAILQLFDRDFGMSAATYLMAYCGYIAASMAALDLQDGVSGAQHSLNMCLKVLHNTRASCPGIQLGIDLVVGALTSLSTKAATAVPILTPTHSEPGGQNDPQLWSGLLETQDRNIPHDELPLSNTDQLWDFPAFPFEPNQPFDGLMFGRLDPFAQDWSNMAAVDLESLWTNPVG